ncbi:putative lipid II flippase FtsW [Alloalcanivorax xenomutans]|jgi:cell division protein FtsW|uniref:Probable peptidoglycan glycosyltransferase FtsW n=1 Tax=Alloalcanivorax xenomutans TaxID=1094342 RepID=A0A9Q3W688_9GAMM|nr:putative lipid II flippase FtsW [Alloalcanivorax xenomutans]ERS13784.1 cell division protein FtsW [Alcanivorax sp. PN-3]KYZ84323.1 cell division protein FtsW [Alcanivorax sp. KX64203]ARB46807.1 cell division protein FtsW [Alloalcanivorax xenomutans]MCE7509769.1 putative lipid II flippase FtsW [Alloalcanivorax xenomutans]MCE7522725.1 putative lipid II flippase FtsW [Alloalcanivorax xenomutans]
MASVLMRPRAGQLDQVLMWSAIGLTLVGLVMVTSASLQIAETRLDNPFYYGIRHGTYLLISLGIGAAVYCCVPLALLERLRFAMLPVAVVALVLVFVPGLGREVNGSTRWIALPGMTIQASEIVKLCFVLYLAGYVAQRKAELETQWKAFFVPLGVLGLLTFMLLLEPDFGAVVVLGITTMGMLFLAGVPTLRFLLIGLVAVGLAALVAVAEPYRVARLMSFLDPWADQYGSGYQLTQSLIAFGRGHWFGVGLGNSVQKLFYLPEAHTDFVFAVLAEEWGLFGTLLLIFGFGLLGWRVFRIGHNLEQRGFLYHAYVVYGIAFVFCAQAFINLGVNMGVLPTKGLTLPFVSYGGSSLVISAVMVALVLRASAEQQELQARGRAKR